MEIKLPKIIFIKLVAILNIELKELYKILLITLPTLLGTFDK